MATICFEIELSVTGCVQEDEPDVNYYGGVEDAEIMDIGIVGHAIPTARNPALWQTKSVMDGVDMNNPEIQKLLSNILEQKLDEIEEAIYQEAHE